MSKPTKGRPPVTETKKSTAGASRRSVARPPAQSREDARRAQAARRKKALRRRRAVFSTALILVMAAVGIVLSLTVFFKVDNIQVVGKSRYSKEEITNASGFHMQENLFLANSTDAGAAIVTKLPYIYEVSVKKSLPGTLRVEVKETVPAYAIKQGEKYVLLDDRCKVLQADVEKPPGTAALLENVKLKAAAPGAQAVFDKDSVGALLLKITQAAKAEQFSGITALDLKNENQLFATYQNRIRLQLGTDSDLAYKFRFAKKAIAKLDDSTPGVKGTLNLTVKKNAYWTEETGTK